MSWANVVLEKARKRMSNLNLPGFIMNSFGGINKSLVSEKDRSKTSLGQMQTSLASFFSVRHGLGVK